MNIYIYTSICIHIYIYKVLFAERPVIILIEDAHEMDECSWRVLLTFPEIQVKAFLVMTQLPINNMVCICV
jgi:hypothetical protein